MRMIKFASEFLFYKKIFSHLVASKSKLVLWQVEGESGQRQIHQTSLRSYSLETQKIYCELKESSFHAKDCIYGYAEEGSFIFKTHILEMNDSGFSMKLPEEVKLLEDSEITPLRGTIGLNPNNYWVGRRIGNASDNLGSDIMRVKSMAQRSTRDQDLLHNEFTHSIDEEDILFASQRESPRSRPREGKWVKIAKVGGNGPILYQLFDLSRGGLGFLCSLEQEFPQGSDLHVIGFGDFELDDPLVCRVMSIRPMDGHEVMQFKVGVKFIEGQD